MTEITLKAPAKVNLYLDIEARRPDGYHDIESVMQTVSLCDELTIERRDARRGRRLIAVSCSVDSLACDESNLCYRAAQLFMRHIGERSFDLAIHIEKRIPIAAGLAGGSTDAAAVLIGLNRLYATNLTEEELCKIGAGLGADIPFCVRKGIAVTRGIGDRLSDCARLPEDSCKILIAYAGEGVSTPLAYRRLDELYDFAARESGLETFTAKLETGEVSAVATGIYNIFESAVLPERPVAATLKAKMLELGALGALMSGSGPSVFGIFEPDCDLDAAKRELEALGAAVFICEPYYNIT